MPRSNKPCIQVYVYSHKGSTISLSKEARVQIFKTINKFVGLVFFQESAGSTGVGADVVWDWFEPGFGTEVDFMILVQGDYSTRADPILSNAEAGDSEELGEMLREDLEENTLVVSDMVFDIHCVHRAHNSTSVTIGANSQN